MHPFEKFRQNTLVKIYFMKDFSFLTHELKQRKTLVQGLLQCKTLEISNLPCALETIIRKYICFQIKRSIPAWAQIHDMLIDENKLICAFIQSYCVKFARDYDEARD